MDVMELFERGTDWTAGKIPGATGRLDDATPCEKWNVRALLNHLMDSQRFFAASARGEQAPLGDPPPDTLGDDPAAQYAQLRSDTIEAFRAPGVLERAGRTLGIAFVDQLVHGWDLAKATGQDTAIPADLAAAAFSMIDGNMPDDRRGSFFKPAVPVPDDADVQAKLLAYGGRQQA